MRPRVLLLLVIILATSYSGSARLYDTTESDIVTLEQIGSYLVAGGSRGEVIIRDMDGETTILQQFEVRNQIIDIDISSQMLYALTQYNYINTYNLSDYSYSGQIQVSSTIEHLKLINATTLLTATDNGSLVIQNLQTQQSMQYPLYNNPFQSTSINRDVPDFKQYLGNASSFSIPQCLCSIGDLEISDDLLYVTYAGRLYTIDLDGMILRDVEYLSDRDSILEVEIDGTAPIVAEIGGKRLYRDGETRSFLWTIEDIEVASNGLVIATPDTIRAELDGNWIHATPEAELYLRQVEIWHGDIYVAGEGSSAILRIDDFEDTLVVLPSWTLPVLYLLLLGIGVYLLLSRISWVNTYLLLLNHRLAMRRGNFDTMQDYLDARSHGFVDKTIRELVERMGYSSYASFLHSMEAITSEQYISLHQSRQGSYLDTELPQIDPPEEIPDYVGSLFQKLGDLIRVFGIVVGHLILMLVQFVDVVILAGIIVLILSISLSLEPTFVIAVLVYAPVVVVSGVVIDSQYSSSYPRQFLVSVGVLLLVISSVSITPGSAMASLPGEQPQIHISDFPGTGTQTSISTTETIYNIGTMEPEATDDPLLDINTVNGTEVRLHSSGLVSWDNSAVMLQPQGMIVDGFIFPTFVVLSTSSGLEILSYTSTIITTIEDLPIDVGFCDGCAILDHTVSQNQSRIISELGYEYSIASNGTLRIKRDHNMGFLRAAQMYGSSSMIQDTPHSIKISLQDHQTRYISEESAITSMHLQEFSYAYTLANATLRLWDPAHGEISLDLSLLSPSTISDLAVDGDQIWVVDDNAQVFQISLDRIVSGYYFTLDSMQLYLSVIAVVGVTLLLLSRSIISALRRKKL